MTSPRLTPYDSSLGMATVRMWRRAFEMALGLPLTNGPDSQYQHQLEYLESQYHSHEFTHVLHPRSPRVLGFMAQQGALIEHLYLSPAIQRAGVGARLLSQARMRSPTELQLYTFSANRGARAFYRAQGFREVAFGRAALADNPWATSVGQLDDVLLRWYPG